MLTSKDIAQRKVEIEQLANKYGIQSVRIYGSVARGCADEDSDVDLLVEAKDGWSQSLVQLPVLLCIVLISLSGSFIGAQTNFSSGPVFVISTSMGKSKRLASKKILTICAWQP